MDLLRARIPTERLVLVPISRSYAETIFLEFNAAVTTYMTPGPNTVIDTVYAFIDGSLARMGRGEKLEMAVLHGETGEFLGDCGLRGLKTPVAEFGIWLKQSAHGHGYGREAVHGLYDFACRHFTLDHFIYPVDRRNIPSRRIPESLGGWVAREYKKINQSGFELDIMEYRIEPRIIKVAQI